VSRGRPYASGGPGSPRTGWQDLELHLVLDNYATHKTEPGILPPADRQLLLFQRWIAEKLAAVGYAGRRRLLRLFATWHVQRRLNTPAGRGPLTGTQIQQAPDAATVNRQVNGLIREVTASLISSAVPSTLGPNSWSCGRTWLTSAAG
jgi:hypothetical protein